VSADQYHTLTLTPLGREVMAGRIEDVRLTVPDAPRARGTGKRRRRRRSWMRSSR